MMLTNTDQPLGEPERSHIVDLIESAERRTPQCVCGATTGAIDEPGGVWLECSRAHQPRQGVSRLLPWLDPHLWHTRQLIVEL